MIKEFDNVKLSTENNIATITLNRPDCLNAVSPKLVRDLLAALSLVAVDKDSRAVIFNGAGKSFSAGGDIEEDVATLAAMKPFEFKEYISKFSQVARQIVTMEKPVIAAVQGYVIGAGFDFALACDIRIAAEGAMFCNGYVRMGLASLCGANYLLPRIIGLGNANSILFSGDFVDAAEAYRMGLVQKVVPEGELENTARKMGQRLANGPTRAIAMTKLAVNRSLTTSLDESTDYSQNLSLGLIQTADHIEALKAFREKRKPNFTGK